MLIIDWNYYSPFLHRYVTHLTDNATTFFAKHLMEDLYTEEEPEGPKLALSHSLNKQ